MRGVLVVLEDVDDIGRGHGDDGDEDDNGRYGEDDDDDNDAGGYMVTQGHLSSHG